MGMDLTDLPLNPLQNAMTIGTALVAGGVAIAQPPRSGDILRATAVIANTQSGAFYASRLAQEVGAIRTLLRQESALNTPARLFCLAVIPFAFPHCMSRNLQGIHSAIKNSISIQSI